VWSFITLMPSDIDPANRSSLALSVLKRSAIWQSLTLPLLLAGCAKLIGAQFDELRAGPTEGGTMAIAGAPLGGSPNAANADRGGIGGRSMMPLGGEGGVDRPATSGRGAPVAGMPSSVGGTAPEDGGEGGEGLADDEPECATNAACIDAHDDEPYICRQGRCMGLLSDSCWTLLPRRHGGQHLRQDGVVIIGGFTNNGPRSAPVLSLASVNWDLALEEFNSGTSGGELIAGGPRPFVGLICDPGDESIAPSIEHLVKDLGVRAILSMLRPDTLYQAFQQTRRYAEEGTAVFFFSMTDADLRLARLNDNGLMWHMQADPRRLAETIAGLVRHIEPTVNARRAAHFAETGNDDPAVIPLRLTIVSSDHPSMVDIANVLTTADADPKRMLVFNGKSAAVNGTDFDWIDVGTIPRREEPGLWNSFVDRIYHRQPHIIVTLLEGDQVGNWFVPMLEQGWSGRRVLREGLPRPHYVMSHLLYPNGALATQVLANEGRAPPLALRLVGPNFARARDKHSQVLYGEYLARLQQANPRVLNLDGTENTYDGAYSLLYAYAAAANVTVLPTGAEVRDGLKDYVFSTNPESPQVDIGPTNVANVVSRRVPISLWGTMGLPNFDLLSGTRLNDTSAWCVDVAEGTFAYRPDALLFNPETGAFEEPPNAPPPACMAAYSSAEGTSVDPPAGRR
jgi:hypothetical protein